MATIKKSAPGLDGIPKILYRCAGGLGSQFLYNAYKQVIEGGPILALFSASRTMFIATSSDVDNNGRIVRSLEALRPLTLCNCDCKVLTSATCRGLQFSAKQMTGSIFEIETTFLAHVAYAPHESGILLTDFAAAYRSDKSFLDLPCTGRKQNCLSLYAVSCERSTTTAKHTSISQE